MDDIISKMTVKVTVTMPRCGRCGAVMHFADPAWVETETMVLAGVVCSNEQCRNPYVVALCSKPAPAE